MEKIARNIEIVIFFSIKWIDFGGIPVYPIFRHTQITMKIPVDFPNV